MSRRPTSPSLVVTVRHRISVQVAVDVHAFFASLPQEARSDYWAIDLHHWGYTHEWQRPMAFLMSLAEPEVEDRLGAPARADSHVEDVSERVSVRSGHRVEPEQAEWSETDHATLATALPWMKPTGTEPEPWRPGPDDIPLFEVGA